RPCWARASTTTRSRWSWATTPCASCARTCPTARRARGPAGTASARRSGQAGQDLIQAGRRVAELDAGLVGQALEAAPDDLARHLDLQRRGAVHPGALEGDGDA